MACKKCNKDKSMTNPEPITNRLFINCPGCGLMRLLPDSLEVNTTFDLVPCPKCGSAFCGTFVGNGVEGR